MSVLMPLTPTKFAAWCDRCLRGSEVIAFDAPPVARFFAIERLRGAGWLHVADASLDRSARQDADRLWSGATYCIDCASEVARGRAAPSETSAPTPRRSASWG
jgi:hypothetical protein